MTQNEDTDLKLNKDLKFSLFTKSERESWRNLDMNIDSFCDKWVDHRGHLNDVVYKLNQLQIKEVCKIYKLSMSAEYLSYYDLFLSNIKSSIDFYCIVKFISVNPLAYSRIFGVPKSGTKINKRAVYIKALATSKKTDLRSVYIQLMIQKRGKAKYSYDLTQTNKVKTLQEAQKILNSLTRYLKRIEKKKYHLRYIDKTVTGYHFLLLKETNDKLYPAIPQNLRVLMGAYLLISIDYQVNKLLVYTNVAKEASRIRYYIAKRTESQVRYVREYAVYKPDTFFSSILTKKASSALRLIDVEFRKHNLGDSTIQVKDRHRKNDIIDTIIELKKKFVLNLVDFSEFKSFTFLYAALKFKVDIHEDRWGQLKLEIQDKGLPALELTNFKAAFEADFRIPFNKHLKHTDANIDKGTIVRKILDKPTIELTLPDHVEEILLDLIDDKVIDKPIGAVKRRCINCYYVYWRKGECPRCGSEAYFEGDYIDIHPDVTGTLNLLLYYLRQLPQFKVKKINRQIDGSKFTFIDILNKVGDPITLYVALNNVHDKIVTHFQETGNPLIVVLLKFKSGILPDIEAKGFACVDLSSIYYQLDTEYFGELISKAIQTQKDKWKEKLIEKGYNSYERFIGRNPKIYTDQQFEKDIYNMLHEIFLVGDRLGGKFAGVKAPDGIVSIQNYMKPMFRYCMAWDCKYSISKNGYRLNDSPKKHRHYINALKVDEKVMFYGDLKTYAIISQNMNFNDYEKFNNKVLFRFRWVGQIVFIDASVIVFLYRIFRDNSALISSHPEVFFSRIYKLFKETGKRDSLPFKQLTLRRAEEVAELIKKDFTPLNKSFVFERAEFD